MKFFIGSIGLKKSSFIKYAILLAFNIFNILSIFLLVGSYKEIDIIILLSTNDLITYSKNINKENTKNVNTIKKKDITIQDMQNQIQTLESENEKLRDGRTIKEKDNKILELNNTIKTQKEIIIQKNNIISNLEKTIDKIQKSFEKI